MFAPSARRSAAARTRSTRLRRSLLASDVLALGLAFALIAGAPLPGPRPSLSTAQWLILLVVAWLAWTLLARTCGLYDRHEQRVDHAASDDLPAIVRTALRSGWALALASFIIASGDGSLVLALYFIGASVVATTAARGVVRMAYRRWSAPLEQALIIGAGVAGHRVAAKLAKHPEYGIAVLGFVDSAPLAHPDSVPGGPPLLGGTGDVVDLVDSYGVERVIVAFSTQPDDRTVALVRALRARDCRVDIVPRLFESLGPASSLHMVEGLTLVGLEPLRLPRLALCVKRVLDVLGSLLALALLAPLLVAIAAIVRLDSPGPAFFRQQRVTKNGRVFTIYKFRTMASDAEQRLGDLGESTSSLYLKLGAEDPRVTRVGAFLRRYSLDEIPQFLNVLKGDLSLVGPRPLPVEQVRANEEALAARHAVRAGLSGWWQILGRSGIGPEEAVQLDVAYIENWSLALDLFIIGRTLRAMLGGQGAY